LGNHAQGTAQISKLQFNRMLETNAVPTIWISNRTEGIDPAYLRRFMYVIEFRALGAKLRARVLARYLKDDSLLGPDDIDEIAERYDVSPAQLSTAVEAARLVASDARPARRTIERVLESSDRLLRGTARPLTGKFDPSAYTLAGLNASQDLAVLAGRLAGWKPGHGPGLAICLYGPPGTGKSEYVHYLAHVMSRPLIHRRASDIIRPYVGETERLIADAFREAASEDAVLLFDEADSFIRTRERAHVMSAERERLKELEHENREFHLGA
jgi:transitional endoplasmic reticulum ATPase